MENLCATLGRATKLKDTLEMFISCENLNNVEVLGKSDPQVHVYIRGIDEREWTLVDKSEVQMNNLNPEFQKVFEVDYAFEEPEELLFQVFDDNGENGQTLIGEHIGLVSDLVLKSSEGEVYEAVLESLKKAKSNAGDIIIKVNNMEGDNSDI